MSGIALAARARVTLLRALKLAKWSTCGAEPSLKKTNIIKGPSRLPESTLGLLGRLSLPI